MSASINSDRDKAILFNMYFYSIFTQNLNNSSSLSGDIPDSIGPIDLIQVTEEEVLTILQSLDPNKSMGIDGIGSKILKTCGIALYHLFHHLFTLSLTQGILPASQYCPHL